MNVKMVSYLPLANETNSSIVKVIFFIIFKMFKLVVKRLITILFITVHNLFILV